MKQAGIRQLKNSLSGYIKRVKKGETIAVTERGKTVAILKKETVDSLNEKLEACQGKGLIRMGEGGTIQGLKTGLKKIKGSRLSKTVIEDRR